MSPSIRLRLIDRLQSILDRCRERVTKDLGRNDTHSVSGYDPNARVMSINALNSAQTNIDNAVGLSAFNDQIVEQQQRAVINNVEFVPAQDKLLAGLNNNFVAHQQYPCSQNYCGTLGSKKSGVES